MSIIHGQERLTNPNRLAMMCFVHGNTGVDPLAIAGKLSTTWNLDASGTRDVHDIAKKISSGRNNYTYWDMAERRSKPVP